MDYKDIEAGHSSSFWVRAKEDLTHRLLSKTLKKNKKVSNLKILNLGAGTGEDLEILNKFGDVYVIDINKKALDLIKEGQYVEKKVCDACNLIYSDNFFDVVISLNVFEHIDKDRLAIKEAYRVLKKRGYLIFLVPAFQFLYSSHDKALEHKRRYSKKILRNILSQFEELELNYWNFFLFLPIATLRLKNKNSEPKIDVPNLPFFLDNLFFGLLKTENFLIKNNFLFPFGLTIIGIYRK